MALLSKILVPLDFSDDSARALQYAEELARQFGAELILLHVDQVLPPIAIGAGPGAGYDPSALEALGKIAAEQHVLAERDLGRTAERLRAGGLKATTQISSGAPFVEIVRTAQERGADLITMGTHGRSGLAHMLLGSVAERVLRKAPCPVLVVRHPDRKFKHPLGA